MNLHVFVEHQFEENTVAQKNVFLERAFMEGLPNLEKHPRSREVCDTGWDCAPLHVVHCKNFALQIKEPFVHTSD